MQAAPFLLIAMPQLADPNFARSVVLILHHETDGAMGLILNRPTTLPLGTFAHANNFVCQENFADNPVFCGGPVEQSRGWILHEGILASDSRKIGDGVFVSGSLIALQKVAEEGVDPARLYLGYSGWSASQLETEMSLGAWMTTSVNARYIFETPALSLWETILKDMGIDPLHLSSSAGVH